MTKVYISSETEWDKICVEVLGVLYTYLNLQCV